MKKLVSMCLLVLGQVASDAANLNLLYPIGGEQLPGNGTHVFTWTNSASIPIVLNFDWYDTNGSPVLTNNAIYSNSIPAGINMFTFTTPSNYPGPLMYQYKVHIVGTDSGTNIEATSGFVTVTDPMSFSGSVGDTNQWLPNQSKAVMILWSGLQSNDVVRLTLEAPALSTVGPGYGFLLTNIVVTAGSGTRTVTVAYPTVLVPAYPPATYTLADGQHVFTLANQRCGIIQSFGSVDIVKAGLRMYLTPGIITNVTRGQSIMCSKIMLDAALATNDVRVVNIVLTLTSYSTNWLYMFCNLMDGKSTAAMDIVNLNPQQGSNYNTQAHFPMNVLVPKGQTKELDLVCFVQAKTETGSFIWNADVNLGGQVGATYTNGAPIVTSVIPSSSTYVSIQEIINSVFYGSGSVTNDPGGYPGGNVLFDVMVKAQTSYSVLTSTNLADWDTLLVTNSASDGLLSLLITNRGSHHFFKLKEN